MPKNLEKTTKVFVETAQDALKMAANDSHYNSEKSEALSRQYQKCADKLTKIGSGDKLNPILSELLQKSVGPDQNTSTAAAISEATTMIIFSSDIAIPRLAEALGKTDTDHFHLLSRCFGGGGDQ